MFCAVAVHIQNYYLQITVHRKIPIILIKHTRYFVIIFIVKSPYHHRNTIIKLLYLIIGYNLQFGDARARTHKKQMLITDAQFNLPRRPPHHFPFPRRH